MAEIANRRLPPVAETAWMQVLPPATRWVLHGAAAVRRTAALVWGVDFAEHACRAIVQGPRATLWLGPDEYLLLDRDGEANAAEMRALEQVLSDLPHALVDVSHRQFSLEITGPQAVEILRGACPLDLDIAEFPVGMCTRTVLAKADILLWRTGTEVFHLDAWRSFSGYVTGILREIAGQLDPPA